MNLKDRMSLIYIEWVDASSNSGWMDKQALDKWVEEKNWSVSQVGWVYKETKNHLILIGRLEQDSGTPLFGQLQKIPKTWIVKRKVLKL